jgi:hypothetical protein
MKTPGLTRALDRTGLAFFDRIRRNFTEDPMTYSRLVTYLINSNVWPLPLHARCVFLAMIESADKRGVVEGSFAGIANRSNVTPVACAQAIRILRREALIARNGTGWMVVKYKAWRESASLDEARANATRRQRERRARIRARKEPAKTRVAKQVARG